MVSVDCFELATSFSTANQELSLLGGLRRKSRRLDELFLITDYSNSPYNPEKAL